MCIRDRPSAQTRDKTSVNPEQMIKLVDDLREEFDYILLDCPAGIEQGFYNAIAGADRALAVSYTHLKQAMIRDQIMARGTVNASVMTPREVLIEGLRCRAVSMVLVHNHPSGDPTPSRADMLLTKRLKEAGELVGITLIDHVVIGDRRYLSFREENLM